jgi:formamidopyrimidine-DNA glycosylase
MPELPEVETICGYLREGGQGYPSILGMPVEQAQVYWPGSLAEPDDEAFRRRIPGQRVAEIDRRGKYLVLRLSADTLLVHLRMSGDLRVEPVDTPPLPHDRVALEFATGWKLAFNDPRKFGRMWLVSDPQTVLAGLGPEPLSEEFTAEWLWAALQQHRRQIKPLLLDQSFIAGLGNIYTDEALHRARLHPLEIANRLTAAQAAALWESIRAVLAEGIQRQGASIDWVYRGGDFQNYFQVYQRTGQPCSICGTPIQRLVVGQRGTHICPSCQDDGPAGEHRRIHDRPQPTADGGNLDRPPEER